MLSLAITIVLSAITGCISIPPQQKNTTGLAEPSISASPLETSFEKDPLCLSDSSKSIDGPNCLTIFPQISERNAPVVKTDVYFSPKSVYWPYESCEIRGVRNLKILERKTDTASKDQLIYFTADFYLICKHIFNSDILIQNKFMYQTKNPNKYAHEKNHFVKFTTNGATNSKKYAEGWKPSTSRNSLNPDGKVEFIKIW